MDGGKNRSSSRRRLRCLALPAVALAVLGACSGGAKSGSAPLKPIVTNSTSTTSGPATTGSTATTATTKPPAPATTVTTRPVEPALGTRCQNVVFSPNSENGASNIQAFGLSCAEAEALVRNVGGPLGPVNGLPRTEADGFTCVRTSQSDLGLPSASYECTRGAQRITFVRT